MLKTTILALAFVASIVALNGEPIKNDPDIKGEMTINGKKHVMHIKGDGKSGYIVFGGKHVPFAIKHGKATLKLHGQTITFNVGISHTTSTHYITWYGKKVLLHFAAGKKSGYFMWKKKKVGFTVDKGGVLRITFGGKVHSIYMGEDSVGNACGQRAYKVDDNDCWGRCGRKSGACNWCGANGFCCRKGFKGCAKRLLAHASSKHHTCVRDTHGQAYKINNKDCWNQCGKKGGPCNFCGAQGFCCRKGHKDCPQRLQDVALSTHHACIKAPCGQTYKINNKDCWNHCGRKGGACKWCGVDGFCCRKGYKGCAKRMIAVALSAHHSCIRDTYSNDEEKRVEDYPHPAFDEMEQEDIEEDDAAIDDAEEAEATEE